MKTLDGLLSLFEGHMDQSLINEAVRDAYQLGFKESKNETSSQSELKIQIEEMLLYIEGELAYTGRKNLFVESLRDQFDDSGNLSPKQLSALKEIYERT